MIEQAPTDLVQILGAEHRGRDQPLPAGGWLRKGLLRHAPRYFTS